MKQSKTKYKYALKFILSVLFVSIISNQSISQVSNWHPAQKLTSGFNDRNPSFGTPEYQTFYTYLWEFMVFERSSSAVNNKICILKIGQSGSTDSVEYLTDSATMNFNPSISYDIPVVSGGQINIALALWESNRNGRTDIYGSFYTAVNGWSSPFPFDTSNFNKTLPRSIYLNNSVFAVIYEKDNDIIYRHFNPQTQTVSYDTNLTANDTSVCKNPNIGHHVFSQFNYSVSYERKKPDGKNAVYFRKSNGIPVWSAADTLAYAGNNINSEFVYSNFGNSLVNIFYSDRTGNYNIYCTIINSNGSLSSQEIVVSDSYSDKSNFNSVFFPVITDNNSQIIPSNSFINYHAAAYIKKGIDSAKVKFLPGYFSNNSDSSTAGDSSANITMSMNRGLKFGNWDAKIWAVYNKDSASYSMLYGRSIDLIISEIVKTESTIPENFVLHQNYPNPFNPVTKIKFSIPENSFVKITICDVLGKEIDIPVNRNLDRGSYEVTWDGSEFAGGVYFYRFETESYSDVKKLILLK